jgi:hypothetical protein
VDGCGGKLFGVERVGVADEAGVGVEDLGVGDLDVLAAVALDGIDVNAEDAAVGIFEEGGIAFAADDVFVDGAGLVGVEELGAGFLAVDFHAELVDLRGLGNGEEVGAFEGLGIGVVEFLVDGGGADLAVDFGGDVVEADFQRGEGEALVGQRRGVVDDDESIRADRGDEGERDGGGEEKEDSGFHALTVARVGNADVREAGKICKKDVRAVRAGGSDGRSGEGRRGLFFWLADGMAQAVVPGLGGPTAAGTAAATRLIGGGDYLPEALRVLQRLQRGRLSVP